MAMRGWQGVTQRDLTQKLLAKQQPRSKYNARKTTVDNIVFDSAKEATRYGELKVLEQAGEIWDLELQPRYPLRVLSTSGQLGQASAVLAGTFDDVIGEWRGDFRYRTDAGIVVEDVKGFKTALYKWKKRHVERQYHIQILET
jgi:hypothetical protein